MRTSALLKLHQREIDILDMIIKAENNKKAFERDGFIFRNKSNSIWYGDRNSINHVDKMVKRYEAIKQRLIRYYEDVKIRIDKMAFLSETENNLLTQNELN